MASAESVDLADQKRLLRQVMRDRRLRLTADEGARASAVAAARLAALHEMQAALSGGGCVAGFVATRGEIDPAAVLASARAAGAQVALPRVTPATPQPRSGSPEPAPAATHARLYFHLAGPDDLSPGRFGILEPDASCPEVLARDAAVMIVPGVAFDEAGRRLGLGGGYYDEVLGAGAGVNGAGRPRFVVGLGYDFQIVDVCPAGPDDARVDCVVTEARVIRCTDRGQGATS